MHTQRTLLSLQQTGFVLIVALVLLLVLTLLGLAAAQSTSLQERMAGNARNHDIAFQAAEAGLRAGEGCVKISDPACSTFSVATTGGNGAYLFNAVTPPTTPLWNQPGFWSNPSNVLAYATLNPTSIPNVATPPEIIIEQLPAIAIPGNGLGQSQYGGNAPPIQRYRITVLGTGGDSNSTVLLQSLYHP